MWLTALSVAVGAHAQSDRKLPDTYNFRRGVEAYENGQYDDAGDFLKKELEENPKNGYAYYYLASVYMMDDSENYGDVLKELNLALKNLPKKDTAYRAAAYGRRGNVQAALGDTLRALEDFSTSATTDAEGTQALLDRADIWFAQNKYDLADADYEEAIRRDESCTTAFMGLGRNAMERKDYVTATRHFTHVLKLDPSYGRAYSFRARSCFEQKKYREAAADAITALEVSQHIDLYSYSTLYNLADSAYVHIETQLRAKMLRDNTDDMWPYHLGMVYSYTGHYHQAISAFEKHIAMNPAQNAAMNVQIAMAYSALYDYPAALRHADMAVAADTTESSCFSLRGVIHYNLDQKEEALDDMNRAVALAPDNPDSYTSRGWLKELYSDYQGALDDFTTALTLEEKDANSHMHRARILYRLGDTAAAQDDFRRTLDLDTVPSEAQSALFSLIALGEKEKAKAWNDSILSKSRPADRPGDFYNAACAYSLMNENEKALSYLQQAFENGYRDFVHMGYDTDMDNIRQLSRYRELTEKYSAIYKKELLKEDTGANASPDDYEQVVSEVPFTRENGIYKVKCTINGLPLHFYFDTGAADVTISSVEAAFMLKNGYLNRSDIGGKQYYGNASGEITEGTTITLRNVEFGGLVLPNVKASVVHNQAAPLLLGQTVLSRLGKIEIDYKKNIIRITHLKAKGL